MAIRFLVFLCLTALSAAVAFLLYLLYWIGTRAPCPHCGKKLCDCEWDEYW